MAMISEVVLEDPSRSNVEKTPRAVGIWPARVSDTAITFEITGAWPAQPSSSEQARYWQGQS